MEVYAKIDIFEAIIDGDMEHFYHFCERGGINRKDGQGVTPLMMAAKMGNVRMVEFLLIAGASVNAQDNDGWSALMYASELEKVDIAQLLIDHKANLNKKDREGWTPLRIAVVKGRRSIVRLLLDKGANPNLKDTANWTPLQAAIWKSQAEIVKWLIHSDELRMTQKQWREMFQKAALFGNIDIMGAFMDAGMCADDLHPNQRHQHAGFLAVRRRLPLILMRYAYKEKKYSEQVRI